MNLLSLGSSNRLAHGRHSSESRNPEDEQIELDSGFRRNDDQGSNDDLGL